MRRRAALQGKSFQAGKSALFSSHDESWFLVFAFFNECNLHFQPGVDPCRDVTVRRVMMSRRNILPAVCVQESKQKK